MIIKTDDDSNTYMGWVDLFPFGGLYSFTICALDNIGDLDLVTLKLERNLIGVFDESVAEDDEWNVDKQGMSADLLLDENDGIYLELTDYEALESAVHNRIGYLKKVLLCSSDIIGKVGIVSQAITEVFTEIIEGRKDLKATVKFEEEIHWQDRASQSLFILQQLKALNDWSRVALLKFNDEDDMTTIHFTLSDTRQHIHILEMSLGKDYPKKGGLIKLIWLIKYVIIIIFTNNLISSCN